MTIGACFLPGTQHVDTEFRELVKESEAAKKVKRPWRALLRRSNRPHFFTAVFLPMLQQLTNINVVMFYQPILFKTLGMGSHASLLSSTLSGLINVVATLVSIAVVDSFGRRVLFL